MKLNHKEFNYFGYDIKICSKHLGDNVEYLGTFCIKGNYFPCAVFYSPDPNLEKGHKNYPFLHSTDSEVWIGAMDESEFEDERYQDGIYCIHCDSVIYSVNRHDYRMCNCKDGDKKVSIDGGRDYTIIGYGSNANYKHVRIDFKTGEVN